MLNIKPDQLVGKGLHREVYRHPEDSSKCLKIVIQDKLRENSGDEETLREQAYYTTLIKRGISWHGLPKFYGNIETNLGTAAIFDLVRDIDGNVAKTLEYYLASEELTQQNLTGLIRAMIDLKATLIADSIVTMTIKSKNIVYQKTSLTEGRLLIIDNIGNSDFWPIADHIGLLARLKTKRKWQRFEASILAITNNRTAHSIVIDSKA
ncbi:MAG: hypothetical protein ACJAQS_001797 [Porticoccus sp.]|jgi:hypothetical protein